MADDKTVAPRAQDAAHPNYEEKVNASEKEQAAQKLLLASETPKHEKLALSTQTNSALSSDLHGLRADLGKPVLINAKVASANGDDYAPAPGNVWARRGLVAARGLGRAPEGLANAFLHDATHLDQFGAKVATASAIGIGMKVLLPRAGAAKAIVGTVMLGAMAKDLIKPVWNSMSMANKAEEMKDIDHAANTLGNGVGAFAWDTAIGGLVGTKAEKLTGSVLEARLGTARYSAFERAKVDFFTTDEYAVGRTLNRITKPIDSWASRTGDKLIHQTPKVELPADAIEQISAAHAKHAADYKSVDMYLNGVTGADGKAHGYSQTLDLLQMGVDPKKVSTEEAGRLLAAQAKLQGEPKSIVGPKDNFKGGDNSGDKPGDNTGGQKGDHSPAPKDIGDAPPAAAAAGKYVTKAEQELNVHTLSKMGEMNKQDMAAWTEESVMVQDALSQMVTPMHAAVTPSYKALDPGYMTIRNAMVEIGNQIHTQGDLQHVYPLFNRAWMASNQHIGMGLSEVNGYTHEFNLFAREIHSTLVANMKKAGIDPDVVLSSKNPPLFSISADGGAGPHTMRQIPGVWPMDHVLYPRNMVGTRSVTTSGIYGHEVGHDQYGGILKFDESIREQVIKDAVKNGLLALEQKLYGTQTGRIASEKVNVPGHGDMTKADLYEHIFKAQADENTADIWGAAWTGHNGGGALGILLQSLRANGQLETRNVFGKEFVDPVENPLGFEVHAFDAIRPKIVAETMRARANGDKNVLEKADALERYANEASRPGDYRFRNIESPKDEIVIPRQELEAVVPELIKAQMNTPLPALQGKTFGDVLPDLPANLAKMDTLADLIADAIAKGKKPSEIPFDTSSYTIGQVFGAGMPASLKLVAKGMDATKANAEVNRMSDYLRSQYHANDPHVMPLKTSAMQAIKLTSPRSFVESGRILKSDVADLAGRLLKSNEKIRDGVAARSSFIGGALGANSVSDLYRQRETERRMAELNDTTRPSSDWLLKRQVALSEIAKTDKTKRQILGQGD